MPSVEGHDRQLPRPPKAEDGRQYNRAPPAEATRTATLPLPLPLPVPVPENRVGPGAGSLGERAPAVGAHRAASAFLATHRVRIARAVLCFGNARPGADPPSLEDSMSYGDVIFRPVPGTAVAPLPPTCLDDWLTSVANRGWDREGPGLLPGRGMVAARVRETGDPEQRSLSRTRAAPFFHNVLSPPTSRTVPPARLVVLARAGPTPARALQPELG